MYNFEEVYFTQKKNVFNVYFNGVFFCQFYKENVARNVCNAFNKLKIYSEADAKSKLNKSQWISFCMDISGKSNLLSWPVVGPTKLLVVV